MTQITTFVLFCCLIIATTALFTKQTPLNEYEIIAEAQEKFNKVRQLQPLLVLITCQQTKNFTIIYTTTSN